jgi:transposase-like protein
VDVGEEAIMARGNSHRDSFKQEFWRDAISRQPGSGLSIRGYCRRHRLQEARFYFWRRELSRRGVSAKPDPAFVPVRVTAEQPATAGQSAERPGGCIEIVLGRGRQVRVHGPVDRQSLIEVLAALRFDSIAAPSQAEGEAGPSFAKATEGEPC